MGEGSFLYPFAVGSNIILSAILLKLNIARLIGSIGSKISSSVNVVSKSLEVVVILSASAVKTE